MKAGRELDALIAEKVMGLRWVEETFESHHTGDECTVRKWINQAGSKMGEYGFCPHYSTNIADAWEVVERFVSEGVVFIVKGDGLRTGDFNPKWTVLADNQPRTDADTAPLAICLAALKAKWVTHE